MQSTQSVVYFTPEIDKYFAAWILKSTWCTDNAFDEERFHQFVKALDHFDYEHKFDESYLREKIVEFVVRKHKFKKETAEEYVVNYISKANEILWFLKHTREFPIATIDEWDPPLV